jgi:hypothetical protein
LVVVSSVDSSSLDDVPTHWFYITGRIPSIRNIQLMRVGGKFSWLMHLKQYQAAHTNRPHHPDACR